jgi:hypothetical protein
MAHRARHARLRSATGAERGGWFRRPEARANATAKFDETMDMAVRLEDPKHATRWSGERRASA